jgi:hypothetical protein
MGLFETITYKVIKKDKRIEVRDYDDFVIASTKSSLDKRHSSGFNAVFDYISGNNKKQEKIKMTVPVITRQEDRDLVTSFVMPKKHYADIPEPNQNVFIEEVEGGKFVAIRFSGAWSSDLFDQKDAVLRDYCKNHDLEIVGKRYVFRYQGPYMPSFLRRNEIVYRIQSVEK